jgi:hypothetical protein
MRTSYFPDFLYASPSGDRVCGPGQPGPHEVHQRHQTSQEIRGATADIPVPYKQRGDE